MIIFFHLTAAVFYRAFAVGLGHGPQCRAGPPTRSFPARSSRRLRPHLPPPLARQPGDAGPD